MYSTYKFQTPLQADRLNMIIPGSTTPGLCSKPLFSLVSTSNGNMNINISPFMCYICPNDLANNQSSNIQNAFTNPSELDTDKTSATRLVKLYFNDNINITISGATGDNYGYITLKYNMNTDTCEFSFKALTAMTNAASVDAINKVNEKEIKIATVCKTQITSVGADFSHSFLNSINVKPGYDFNLITRFINNEAKFVYGFKNNNVPFEKVSLDGDIISIKDKYVESIPGGLGDTWGIYWEDNELKVQNLNLVVIGQINAISYEFEVTQYTYSTTSGSVTTISSEKNLVRITPCEKRPPVIKIDGTTLYIG